MNFQITPDRCYCSFGDGIVYEFVPSVDGCYWNLCWDCVFYAPRVVLGISSECALVPCQKAFRSDKNDGFWQISKSIDYQQFTKMLQTGG